MSRLLPEDSIGTRELWAPGEAIWPKWTSLSKLDLKNSLAVLNTETSVDAINHEGGQTIRRLSVSSSSVKVSGWISITLAQPWVYGINNRVQLVAGINHPGVIVSRYAG